MKLLEVHIWDQLVGVLAWNEVKGVTSFEYAEEFIQKGIELSPLITPLSSKVIKIDASEGETFNITFDSNKGLPLFLSDSLPDKFGTELFSKYLEKEGKNYRDLSPIDKLAYVGSRGMGALEFYPSAHGDMSNNHLDINELSRISQSLIDDKPIANIKDMGSLFHIGTSPGGAQPKVLINIDRQNGNIYRGDLIPDDEQDSWILKFNRNSGEPWDNERGKIEYAYYLIARNAGIRIMDSELKEIEGEHYFMTKRFDRRDGKKIHTQTLHAFAGMNFKSPDTYSYEQIFSLFHKIGLNYPEREQLFRIMVFNAIGRNVDDHTKNLGFNMEPDGKWQFSPAYDLTFSYNENYNRETPHFLSVNGKNKDIRLADILHVASEFSIKKPKRIINEVNSAMLGWQAIAEELGISPQTEKLIEEKMRTIPYKLA